VLQFSVTEPCSTIDAGILRKHVFLESSSYQCLKHGHKIKTED